jgi:hypothetical protein
MGLPALVNSVKLPSSLVKSKVILQKHSPEILVVTGTILVVGSAIVACRQTLKAEQIMKKANEDLDAITATAEDCDEEEYTPQDVRNDRMIVYARTGVSLLKCYGPAIIGGAAGLGMILWSHKLLHNRNTAMTVAYTNLLNSFNNYRHRVIEKLGDEEEKFLASGAERKDISIRDENGEDKSVENAAVVHDDGTGHSPYARIFDADNRNWSKNPSANLLFLKSQQQWCNDKLKAEGILFLNDVYRALGFPRVPDGQIIGWVYDPKKEIEDHIGDNYVDFGIYDILYKHSPKIDFLNGYEPCVWLDFNVDGVVHELI